MLFAFSHKLTPEIFCLPEKYVMFFSRKKW